MHVVRIDTLGIGKMRMRIRNQMSLNTIVSGKCCDRRNSPSWVLTTVNRGKTPGALVSSHGHQLASGEMKCCIPPVLDNDRKEGLASAVGVATVIEAWVIVTVALKGIVAIDMNSSHAQIVIEMTGNESVIGIEIVIMINMARKAIGIVELMAVVTAPKG